MTDAYVLRRRPHAVRPLRRRARRRAPRRPRRARVQAHLDRPPGPRPGRDRRGRCFGDANRRGEDNRNVARMAVAARRAADDGARQHGQPPVRLGPGRGDAGQPRDRGRRRLAGRRRRRGVDDPRALGRCSSPRRPFRGRRQTLHSTTLGWRMVNPEMPEQWTISLGREHREAGRIYGIAPRGAGRVRAAQPPARRRAPGTTGSTTTGSSPCPAPSSTRDESIRADTSLEKLAKLKPAFVQGRHGDRGQRLAAQRRRRRRAARRRGRRPPRPRAAGADRRPRRVRAVEPDIFGIGPVEAANKRARARRASAGTTSTRSSSTRRSPRSRWPAWPSGRSSTPRASTSTAARSPSATRSARPARASSARSPTSCGAAAAAGASRRSASASDRDSRWCWRGMTRSATTPTPTPAGLPGLQVDGAAAPEAAADRRCRTRLTEVTGAAARRTAASASSTTTSPASTTASRSASASSSTAGVLDGDGRPVPRHARGDLAGQRRRPLPPPSGPAGRRRWTPTSPARAATVTDAEGRYRFITIKPGAYPWGNHPNAWRPAHIHFSLFGRAFTQRLVTQMYFPGDPLFFQDPIFNSVRDRSARAADDRALRPRRRPRSSGRSRSSSTSCCAARTATPMEEAHA